MDKNKTLDDKKTQILHAAIEIFAKEGLERGKIADIAKQAGIGKGTVYEYFKSKDDIFAAIEIMFIGDSVAQIKKLANSKETPRKKLEEIVNYSLNMHGLMGDAAFIIAELWAQHSREQLKGHKESHFADMYSDFYDTVINILDEGIKANEFRKMDKNGIATLLLALIDGIIWQSVIFKDDIEFNHKIQAAIKSFIEGIKK